MSLLLSSSFALSPHKPPPPSLFLNHPNTSKISVVSGGFSNPRKLSQRTMNTLPIKAAISVDQDLDRKTFDDTKNGVKGLAESGITSIPPFFVHPPQILSKFKLPETRPDPSLVPVVDFTGAESGRREEIVKELARISKEIGFFQITNHGIPMGLLEETVAAVRAFHEQPVELKAPFYHREMSRGSSYYSNVDLFECEAACWGDTLRVMGPPRPEVIPEVCRTQIIETYGRLTKLADLLIGILCEGLGVDPQKYKHLTALEAWTIVGLYYPPCPQPDLTVGQLNHTDPGFFTLLLQDQVGGLQVRYRDEWVDVVPIPGAIAINVGDIFEVMSNGQYISADHRVLANRKKQSRVSTAFFFRPSNWESEFGPFEELISPENPPRYRGFTLTDFVTRFVTQAFDGKGSLLNYYRIEDK